MRKYSSTFASIAAIALLSACGGGGSNAEGPAKEADKTTQEPAEIIIYTMAGGSADDFNRDYGNSFHKKFPNYTLKFITDMTGNNYEKLDRLAANGTHVDLVFATTGWLEKQLFQYGYAFDMTELAKKNKVDLNQFNPSYSDILGGKAFGGGIYYFPMQANLPLLYYNKALFDKFGISYPKDGMNWDEFYDMSRRMTRNDGGVQYAGYIPSTNYLFRGNPVSIPILKPGTTTPTINSDDRWKLFFQKLIADAANSVDPGYYKGRNDFNEFFQGTNAVVTMVSGNMISSRTQLEPMSFDVISLPTLKEYPGIGPQPITTGIAVTKMAKNKDAAMEALKHIVSYDVQSELTKRGIVPVLKSVDVQKLLGTENYFKDKNWSAVFYNKWANFTYTGAMAVDLNGIYTKYGNAVLLGTSDINTALRQAEEEALKKVEELKTLIVTPNVY
ncbi:carbohydrate ABC transporter substrate-binding protein [Paenibacillus mesophilus]|uniref:ABC transporter substrate-binding protein n=1 Tax=Paenibacillus mesophilus TaxID=2582849 RepID=UPI00110F1F6C|nr:ABC transporter substrate-binding protein [Paenibacillus mesophilus]TMV47880.1 carbohydrate ABC transporter substrate-binding protein [Paenibacillus mesophilus]